MQALTYHKEQLLITPPKQHNFYPSEQFFAEPISINPGVCIIMPFNPKMSGKASLQQILQNSIKVIENQLLQQCSAGAAEIIIKRIKTCIASLDYTTYTKSITLFISQSAEKVYYMNIEVQERVIINESFGIRDIVLNKIDQQQFLLLSISNKEEKLFLGNKDELRIIVNNTYEYIEEKIYKGPDVKNDDTQVKNLIRKIDNGLSLILNAYPSPLFLSCTKTFMEYFMQVSKNKDQVLEYLPWRGEEDTESKLKKDLQPYMHNWQNTKERYLKLQLQIAAAKYKVAVGVKEVYNAIGEKKGRLLIAERNYLYPAFTGESYDLNLIEDSSENMIYTKDIIDVIIENVLENGGDVEFVSDGLLDDYMNIVLI